MNPHPAVIARRRRIHRIRTRVAAVAAALFIAAFSTIYVQLASGRDPALLAAAAQVSTTTSGSSDTTTTDSSDSATTDSSDSATSDSPDSTTTDSSDSSDSVMTTGAS